MRRVHRQAAHFGANAQDMGSVQSIANPYPWSMDDADIKRLRKAIQRSYSSSPHKRKYWLALLEQFANAPSERAGTHLIPARPPSLNSALTPRSSHGPSVRPQSAPSPVPENRR